jgi:hypothetical protein
MSATDWAQPHDWFHLNVDIAPGQDPEVVRSILNAAIAQLDSVFLDDRYARISLTEGTR